MTQRHGRHSTASPVKKRGVQKRIKSRPVEGEGSCPAKKLECFNCGNEITGDDFEKYQGDYWCKDCYDEYIGTCESCEDEHLKTDLVCVDGKDICVDCYNEEYAECYKCEKEFEKKKGTRFVGRYYCPSCSGDMFFKCPSCGDTFFNEESQDVGGDLFCRNCASASVVCEFCDDREFPDDMYEYEGDKYICFSCARLGKAVKCPNCDVYFDKENIDPETGLCLTCLENLFEQESEKKYTDDDVRALFPGFEKRVEEVFERSASLRNVDLWHLFESVAELAKVKVDESTVTYTDQHGTRSISFLKSPRSRARKAYIEQGNDPAILDMYVDRLVNKVKVIRDELQSEKIDSIAKAFSAIKVRMYKESKFPLVKKATDDLQGEDVLRIGGHDFRFVITKDPVAIMAKSSGQCWEHQSCERLIRGAYGTGAFSDIANSNLVCFVIDETGLSIARIMIRWCLTDDEKIDFGVERKWYICTTRPEQAREFSKMGSSSDVFYKGSMIGGLSMSKARNFLLKMLSKRGSGDYKSCTTPYIYTGYSDTAMKGDTRVMYRKYAIDE